MATTKQGRPSKAQAGKAPITAHPAFPLVVAMWFAALFGLGSLILPVELIEKLIGATGIAALVPAAAPPLGMTGRLSIALAGALAGVVLGLWIARKAAPAAPETVRQRSFASKPDAARRQPLSAHEDLGSDGFDSVANFASARRRALSSGDEEQRSVYMQSAPLPGEDDGFGSSHDDFAADQGYGVQYDHIAAPRRVSNDPFEAQPFDAEPLDLGRCAEFTEVQDVGFQMPLADEEIDSSAKQVFAPMSEPVSTFAIEPDFEQEPFEMTSEPLPFSPPSMASRKIDAVEASAPAIPQAYTPTQPEIAQPAPVQSSAEAPGAGLIDLVERLGATLEKHREWSAQKAELSAHAAPFPLAVVPTDFGPADPGEAALAMANFFAEPVSDEAPAFEEAEAPSTERQEFIPVPAARPEPAMQGFQPFGGLGRITDSVEPEEEEDHEIDRLAATFKLPLASASTTFAAPPPVPAPFTPTFGEFAAEPESEAAEAQIDGEDTAYPSLLAMKNPFRDNQPEFVRVEEPEPDAPRAAVVFPHEEPQAAAQEIRSFDRPPEAAPPAPVTLASSRPLETSSDNERVLREALMNLQRIGRTA